LLTELLFFDVFGNATEVFFFFGLTGPLHSPHDEKADWQAASWAGLPVTMTPSA